MRLARVRLPARTSARSRSQRALTPHHRRSVRAPATPSRIITNSIQRSANMSLRTRLLQVTLVVFSLAFGIRAQDNQHCSNATMHGSYGFHATGKNFVAIGRFVFDGNGGLTGKLFVRVPGTNIGPIEITGTYSVSPDCIMTDDWGGPN